MPRISETTSEFYVSPFTNLTATGIVPELNPLIPSASAFITIPKAPEPRIFCKTSLSLGNSHLLEVVNCKTSPLFVRVPPDVSVPGTRSFPCCKKFIRAVVWNIENQKGHTCFTNS